MQFVALLSLLYICILIANGTPDISPKYLQECKHVASHHVFLKLKDYLYDTLPVVPLLIQQCYSHFIFFHAGRTGIYLKILIILGCLACITQLIFQILLIVEDPYGSQLDFCK